MSLELFDPTGEPTPTGYRAAPRLATLDGLKIGLFSNGKVNADKLLRYTARSLRATRQVATIVIDTGKRNASRIAEPQVSGADRQ